ncbi:uncharacterized protein A1O5_12302 [Cladophialophora psammophila CBS 110553]|uniref:FAD-binding domain-containing protein n=1 Tax=Cladophialophora psammophila CBS 110553 TaxID=1182543 RepID=W9W4G1_9EURO|nr:uncharacterized protein A1O5_12302 [Cladophialophora psammophila CBS 110553]EXJ59421.1 hypothetical protein A1O5_12302 [Cladophialophora psammophila CBS 110553]
MAHTPKVVVAGAGPAGLLLALLLAREGVQVTVLEANHSIDTRPRALLYGPAAAQVIRRAGIVNKVLERGFFIRSMAWRKLGGEKITEITGMDTLDIPDRMMAYPLNLLAELILEALVPLPNATVLWNHRVTAVSQDEGQAWVEAETHGGTVKLGGDFVVGCDGARSGVRKALFGRNFRGYTWDKLIVTTNVYYDLDKYDWSDLQWTLHPDNWFVSMRITKDGLWRVAYGEDASLTPEQLRERLPQRFRSILPGSPTPDQYRLANFAWFRMHQRCVDRMRVGRIMLAGDAAHLCNPMGGLGLTGGIADVGSLTDCLLGIFSGKAGLDILDKYDRVRREIYNGIIDPLSTVNMNRMSTDGETALETDHFLQMAQQAGKDCESAAEFMMQDLALGADMTRFYNQPETRL